MEVRALQQVSVPPGFKQTEVGIIPDAWEPILLDRVALRGSGHTPNKKHPEYWNGNIKWISLADSPVLDRLYIEDTFAKITSKGIANSSAVLHPAGTVVLSRDAGVGKSAIMRTEMAVSQHFMAWHCGPELDNHYLYYWLQAAKPQFERVANGNTIKTIGLQYFKDLKLPKPPLTEQHAIATALNDVEALLYGLTRLIAKKRDLKQAAMDQLLTGQSRLPGFSGEWERKQLGKCLLARPDYGINAAAVPFSDSLPSYIRITDISQHGRYCPDPRVSVRAPNSEQHYLHKGDVVFARTGASVGKSYLYQPNDGELVFAGFLIRVRPNPEILTSEFLAAYATTNSYWTWVSLMSMRSGQPGINGNEYAQLPLSLPTTPEQTAITAVLSDMDAELEALEARRDKTHALKQAMMQELLTGRTRLV
jgi:type I restriction enzyme S subunit